MIDNEIVEEKPKSKFKKGVNSFFQLCLTVVAGIIVGTIISTYFFTRASVSGDSMLPTYEDGDIVYVSKIAEIQRGDVVVVYDEVKELLLIKRVIGLPEDKIKISNGTVFVNGVALTEDYVSGENYSNYEGVAKEEITLEEDEYFIMGDNRAVSRDSREIGPVPLKDIIGVVLN